MWPVIAVFMRTYAPYFTLPVAAIVGFVGYHLEDILSDKHTPTIVSVKQQREERLLAKSTTSDSNKDFIPKTIFEKNLSPSLIEPKAKSDTKL